MDYFPGTATTNAPYSIVSGGTYNLSGGQESQTVTVRFAPTTVGSFAGNVTFTGAAGASATVTGVAIGAGSITPNPINLASPPASFTIAGSGFADTGFGLPVINFTLGGNFIAQARATSGNSTSLTVPFPTNATSLSGPLPGLRAGNVTVQVYNQTGSSGYSLLGTTTVNDTRPVLPPPGVGSITPNPIDLASPSASFTIAGSGFADTGFGLPVINFTLGGSFIAQARATSGNSTSLTVPFPTNATSLSGPLPGLRAGNVTVQVYNQTGSSGYSLLGTTSLTVNDTRPVLPPPGVGSITPNPIDLASPPASFTIAGSGFADTGFGLPVINFTLGGSFIAQARATSGNSTSLTVPFPTNATSLSGPLPGLRAGNVTVQVYNQTGSSGYSLLGTTSLTVNDTPSSSASSRRRLDHSGNPINLASPPASFTIAGSGFADTGFGLPVINFTLGGSFIAQARATSGNSTSSPFPSRPTQRVFPDHCQD